MSLLVIGVNHRTATVAIREQAALVPEKIKIFLNDVRNNKIARSVVVLSTCNRTEFYIDSLAIAPDDFAKIWCKYAMIAPEVLASVVYLHHDDAVCQHLFRVASGLDSLVLGEPQILGQLKVALGFSSEQQIVSKHLNKLFQLAFHVAKIVRTKTNIGSFSVSVAYTAVQLARQIFQLKDQRVLLVGAGETIELVARHLLGAGVQKISVVNRTKQRALEMTANLEMEMDIYALEQLPELLEHADIIISSTAASTVLITRQMAQQALKKRRNKPILMVDIAIPRDIDEQVGTLDDVYLYSIDDLNTIVEHNYQSRESAVNEATKYLDEGLESWREWCSVAHIGDAIEILETYVSQQREVTTQKILKLINSGVSHEEALRQFGTQLSNRMLHPIIKLVKKLEQERQAELVEKIMQEFIK